jgi:hypothetical protein
METSMSALKRRIAPLTALVAVLAFCLVSTAGAGQRATASPTLYFTYAMNCTFSIVDDSGKPVTSIPPGRYQVDVRTPVQFGTLPIPSGPADMTACRGVPQFQLTGPGVDLFTNMTAGCEMDKVFPETFAPNATYTAVDLNQPTVAHASFTTLASGAPAPAQVTYGGGKGKAELGTDIVGSAALEGTLHALVLAGGAPKLTTNGKALSQVKAGRYKVAIVDEDAKNGLKLLGPTSTAPIVLTKPGFKGKRSVTIKLTSGRWTYYTSLKTVRYFRVT